MARLDQRRCVVISPWARRGHITHVHGSFLSVFRTIERILGLRPLAHAWFVVRPIALRAALPSTMNTIVATGAAALSWMYAEWLLRGKPSMLGIASGAVAGLVAVTPAAGLVGPMGAIVLGAIAGVVCLWAVSNLKKSLGYDDSLDVFPVHGVGGILGTLLAGVFASTALGAFSGQGYAEGVDMGTQVGVQVIGVLATLAYTVVLTWVLLKLVAAVVGLRVSGDEESQGLDTTQHNERGYDL